MVPSGSSGIFSSKSKNFLKMDSIFNTTDGMIDVINDFQWTSSPKTSRQDVPSVMLKEKKLLTNSLVAQLAYYGLSTTGQAADIGTKLGNLLAGSLGSGDLAKSITGFASNALTGIGQTVLGALSNFGGSGLVSGISQMLTGKSPQQFLNQFAGTSVNTGVLGPYDGLYNTEETKFIYRFPYFSDSANEIHNSFASAISNKGATAGLLEGAAKTLESTAYTLAETSNIDAPGIYIEKPQFFNFSDQKGGGTMTFKFPLINTGWAKFEDVQRNWQLIYLLMYQNRANRKSRELIDPPCLYEVMIPGVKFMPYAYISSMKVNFVGSRRSYYINVPNATGGTSKIQTIIPDAYEIEISLTCLVSETQNFLYHMLFEKQDVVSVSSQKIGGNVFNQIKEGFSL